MLIAIQQVFEAQKFFSFLMYLILIQCEPELGLMFMTSMMGWLAKLAYMHKYLMLINFMLMFGQQLALVLF